MADVINNDAQKTTIVSLANLQQAVGKLKDYINLEDAKTYRSADLVNDTVYFFHEVTVPKTAEGTTDVSKAAFSFELAGSDVETLKGQMADVLATLTGYSKDATVADGIAAAVKALADGAVATNTAAIAANTKAISDINNAETGILKQAKDYTDTLANSAVKDNTDAIAAINNETTGIEAKAKKYTDDEIDKIEAIIGGSYTSEATVDAAIKQAKKAGDDAQADVDALKTTVGDMTKVKTTAKTVAGAVDELKDAIDAATTAGEVSIVEAAGEEGTDILKKYTFYQGEQKEENKIGTINIPKDLVVTSGEVVKNPEGQEPGTYLKLVIANQTNPIYINVLDLVNDFTVEKNAAQVQLAISDTREISATVVDKSIARGKINEAFEKDIAAVETALGAKDEQGAYKTVANQIKDNAKDATYKAATEEKEAVTIEGALDDIYAQIGEGGGVAEQIKKAIDALDSTVSTVTEEDPTPAVSVSITQTDGKLTGVTASVVFATDAQIDALFED